MLIENMWYSLDLKEAEYNNTTPLTHLDAQMLSELVLDPILGIKDLKKDQRIGDFAKKISEDERRLQQEAELAILREKIRTHKNLADLSKTTAKSVASEAKNDKRAV